VFPMSWLGPVFLTAARTHAASGLRTSSCATLLHSGDCSRPRCPRRPPQHVCAPLRRTARLPLPPSAMSNDAPPPISDDAVVALAKAAFEHSRSDLRAAAESAPREVQQQQPGITIDLGHKNISRLPDEVIDVIRAEIERCVPVSACEYETC
jgi:hypothetical protein